MHVAEDVYVEWVDDEAVVLSRDTGRVHYLNASAALVFAMIQEYGFEGARKRFARRDDADLVEADLGVILEDMKEAGLLLDD